VSHAPSRELDGLCNGSIESIAPSRRVLLSAPALGQANGQGLLRGAVGVA
jgi:hypothetical protein